MNHRCVEVEPLALKMAAAGRVKMSPSTDAPKSPKPNPKESALVSVAGKLLVDDHTRMPFSAPVDPPPSRDETKRLVHLVDPLGSVRRMASGWAWLLSSLTSPPPVLQRLEPSEQTPSPWSPGWLRNQSVEA